MGSESVLLDFMTLFYQASDHRTRHIKEERVLWKRQETVGHPWSVLMANQGRTYVPHSYKGEPFHIAEF